MTTSTTTMPAVCNMDKLRELRFRYQQDRDLLSADERKRLAFLRWMRQQGRLAS